VGRCAFTTQVRVKTERFGAVEGLNLPNPFPVNSGRFYPPNLENKPMNFAALMSRPFDATVRQCMTKRMNGNFWFRFMDSLTVNTADVPERDKTWPGFVTPMRQRLQSIVTAAATDR